MLTIWCMSIGGIGYLLKGRIDATAHVIPD